jgi:hypothetical protein
MSATLLQDNAQSRATIMTTIAGGSTAVMWILPQGSVQWNGSCIGIGTSTSMGLITSGYIVYGSTCGMAATLASVPKLSTDAGMLSDDFALSFWCSQLGWPFA